MLRRCDQGSKGIKRVEPKAKEGVYLAIVDEARHLGIGG